MTWCLFSSLGLCYSLLTMCGVDRGSCFGDLSVRLAVGMSCKGRNVARIARAVRAGRSLACISWREVGTSYEKERTYGTT